MNFARGEIELPRMKKNSSAPDYSLIVEGLLSSGVAFSGDQPAHKTTKTIPRRKSRTPRNAGGTLPIGGVGRMKPPVKVSVVVVGEVTVVTFVVARIGPAIYAKPTSQRIITTSATTAERPFIPEKAPLCWIFKFDF
jgi:hypothetical protein